MAIKLSTGLRNYIQDTGSLKDALNLSFIKIYSGTPPADANAAIGGGNVLLCTISNNSGATGLTMAAAAVDGVLSKNGSEVWSGVNAESGTASFYRHVTSSDDGTSSSTQRRIQGTVGLAGADMNLGSLALTSGQTQPIDFYTLTLPTY